MIEISGIEEFHEQFGFLKDAAFRARIDTEILYEMVCDEVAAQDELADKFNSKVSEQLDCIYALATGVPIYRIYPEMSDYCPWTRTHRWQDFPEV